MMTYVAYHDFDKFGGKTYPEGTKFHAVGNRIYSPEGFLCLTCSDKAHRLLAIDYDQMGILRGALRDQIYSLLYECDNHDVLYKRIKALWNDKLAKGYTDMGDSENDPWIWNEYYYCAPINDMEYILNLLLQEDIK